MYWGDIHGFGMFCIVLAYVPSIVLNKTFCKSATCEYSAKLPPMKLYSQVSLDEI